MQSLLLSWNWVLPHARGTQLQLSQSSRILLPLLASRRRDMRIKRRSPRPRMRNSPSSAEIDSFLYYFLQRRFLSKYQQQSTFPFFELLDVLESLNFFFLILPIITRETVTRDGRRTTVDEDLPPTNQARSLEEKMR